MDSVCPVNELEQQLKEAGEQLAFPPSSTKDLLDLLDKTEQLLSFVGQAPSISMQGALVHSMGALIGDQLLRHSDMDVRVSVASCLCEVARITAPEPPYKDDIMKEIFQLNVTAFGELTNVTGRSYFKAIHIIASIAKVKSCLLMLDLECDDLILEMFEQFLSRIKSNHPQTVFSDMETIMTLVIEESDEISSDLLSLLISHVRKENQNLSPAPWKLAEKVLRNCNDTLKSYSQTLFELLKSDADDYAEVITTLSKSTKTNNIHKRHANSLENGGSAKTHRIHSHSKKQKHIDTQRVVSNPKKVGRQKTKKNNLNQETRSNSVQTRFQDKEKSKGLKSTIEKPENQSTKRKPSSRGKDLKEGYSLKKYGEELVGCRIKVWWPLDQMYYEGAVFSYDPLNNKYKVLYADGDEELLDLRDEKWSLLDMALPDQQQEEVADLPTPMTTSAKDIKQKGKRKKESSLNEEDNLNSSKSASPADSSKTKPIKEPDIKGANENNVPVEILEDDSQGLKLTKTTIEELEQDVERNPSGLLEESDTKTEKKTSSSENNEELVCEI